MVIIFMQASTTKNAAATADRLKFTGHHLHTITIRPRQQHFDSILREVDALVDLASLGALQMNRNSPGARFTKYLTIYRKIIVSLS